MRRYPLLLCVCLAFCGMGLKRCPVKSTNYNFYAKALLSSQLKGTHRSSKQALFGPPDQHYTAGKRAFFLGPGSHIIVQMDLPSWQGYCHTLQLYTPEKASTGDYRLWISATPKGPWSPVIAASGSRLIDLEGTPLREAQYLRIEDITIAGEGVWIDAIMLRSHSIRWRPLPTPKKPSALQPLLTQAQTAHDEGRQDESLALLRHAAASSPKHPKVHTLLGAVYTSKNEPYQALRHYHKVSPRALNERAHQEIGENYLKLKLWRYALRSLRKCISIARLYTPCYYHLIHATSMSKQKHMLILYRDQYLIVKKRTDIRNRHLRYSDFLDRFFHEKSPIIEQQPGLFHYQEHLDWMNFLLQLFPKDRRLIKTQTTARLKRQLRQKKTRSPKHIAQFYRALLLLQEGKSKKADRLLRRLQKNLRAPLWQKRIFLQRAHLWQKLRNPKKAIRLYKQGIRRLSSSPKEQRVLQIELERLQPSTPKTKKTPKKPSVRKRIPPTPKKPTPRKAKETPPSSTPQKPAARKTTPSTKEDTAPTQKRPAPNEKDTAPTQKRPVPSK